MIIAGAAVVLAVTGVLGAPPAEARTMPSAPAAPVYAGPCAPSVRVCVVISQLRAWLRDPAGHPMGPGVPIMPGAVQEPTPPGMYHVTRKDAHHVSSIDGSPMPWSVFFDNRGRALHEGSLTVPSAGCIHLAHGTAQRFYEALRLGDPIEIRP